MVFNLSLDALYIFSLPWKTFRYVLEGFVCDIYSSMVLTCQTHYHHNRMLSLTFVCPVSFSADRDVVFGAGYKDISHSRCHSVITQIIHKGKWGM